MIFFLGSSAKRKAKKRMKKKQREADSRRMHIIIEAQKKHKKNKELAERYRSKDGFAASTPEALDMGFDLNAKVDKAIHIGGKAIQKVKARQKHLNKSRNTHIAKLKAARSKMVARQRS